MTAALLTAAIPSGRAIHIMLSTSSYDTELIYQRVLDDVACVERDASACMRRHQALALPPVRERRFRVYEEAPGFRPGPNERERLSRV